MIFLNQAQSQHRTLLPPRAQRVPWSRRSHSSVIPGEGSKQVLACELWLVALPRTGGWQLCRAGWAPSRLDLCEQVGQDGLGTSWR